MKVSPIKWIRFRIYLILGLFALIWLGILWRAFQLQVLDREHLAGIAEKECQRTIAINPVRGDIFDRRGEKLAVSVEADSLFANPTEVENKVAAAEQLTNVLKISKSDLLHKFKTDATFVWLKRQVSPEEAAAVEGIGLKGVYSLKESKRFYPNKDLAAQLLGFVGIDSQGLEGLEKAFDEHLLGGCTSWRVMRDALGRTFLDRDLDSPPGYQGARLNLTIDRRIQYITEKALNQVVQTYQATAGVALVVRPQTGEILASAVAPGFNPNVFGQYSASERRNRILTDVFDPGSTFKVFVVAGALEEGLVKPMDLVFCENGEVNVGRHVVHDLHKYGWLTVNKIIKLSSNIGALKIGDMLGVARLHQYLTRFGFGEPTGIDLPGESSGLLRPYKAWRPLDAANVAFGQGVSVTALQMVMAMSAIANDGVLMRPYIVSEIVDSSGRVLKQTEPQMVRRVVSEQTAQEMRDMLRMVVEEGGTGVRADSKGYPAAGKTGTAQKLDSATGRYSDSKCFSSFLGFVPYQDPQLTIFVALDEPRTESYGGTVAAPAFREIAQQVLPLLDVPPVETPGTGPATLQADNRAKSGLLTEVREIAQALQEEARDASPVVAGDEARPTPPGTMPNLSGLSMRRVIDLLAPYEVDMQFSGSGVAVSQTPSPGQAINIGQVCRVQFEQQ